MFLSEKAILLRLIPDESISHLVFDQQLGVVPLLADYEI